MKLIEKTPAHYLFSNRDVTKIVLPIIVEQFLAMLVGMADSVMISSVGEAAVSAVSLVDSISVLIIFMFSAIATGGAVVAGQYLGQRDEKKAQSVTNQLIIVVFIISVAITIPMFLLRYPLLNLIYGSVDAGVMAYSQTYFTITVFSIPFIAIYNGGASVFRAMSDTKTPMLVSILMNAVNICGNAIMIYGMKLGVAGAAIPTLASRVIAAVVVCAMLMNEKHILHFTKPFSFKLEGKIVKRILGIGIPNGIENTMFQFGKLIIVSMISTFGTAQITANAVGNTVSVFQVLPGMAIGVAAVTIISRCYGAGDESQVRFYTRKLLKIAIAGNLAINAVVVAASPLIFGMYNLSQETSVLTAWIVSFCAVIDIALWPASFMLPNAFRATGDVKYTMIISIVSMWMWRVGGSFVLGVVLGYGLYGVWIGMALDWVFRAIFFIARYNGKTWRTHIASGGKSD